MADWSGASQATFEIDPGLLSLPYTLDCGQAFRWRERSDGSWIGVIEDHAVRLRREDSTILCQVYPPMAGATQLMASYLRLDVDLAALYEAFASVDPWIGDAVKTFAGLRVLNQEPRETLLSYICSTANSVPRITKAIDLMSRVYGRPIASLDGDEFHTFPTPDSLAEASPLILRDRCGLGWRGDNLIGVAREVAAMPSGWPIQLRSLPYIEAKAELMRIRGVGAKIADCVCLFALGKDVAVPVDTHIWAVARELFGARVPTRTLTPATYGAISGLFLDRYGPYAGWAQEYLFLQRRASQGRVRSALPDLSSEVQSREGAM
jgi:N-glycosylase/DNA lyase